MISTALTCTDKLKLPLAAQIMGTGKTALGRNIIAVLRRPRETDPTMIEEVRQRLARSKTLLYLSPELASSILDSALRREEDETLVARVLREYLAYEYSFSPDARNRADLKVDAVKGAHTIVVTMGALSTGQRHDSLGSALAASIAKHLGVPEVASRDVGDTCTKCRTLLGNRLVLLVLDDIADIATSEHAKMWDYDSDSDSKAVTVSAMHALRRELNKIHCVEGWMLYCTGRAHLLSMAALVGLHSPLHPVHILLSPLSSSDVLEMIEIDPRLAQKWPDQAVRKHVADLVAERSGGIGRIIVNALSFLRGVHTIEAVEEEACRFETTAVPHDVDSIIPRAMDSDELTDPSLLSLVGMLVLRSCCFRHNDRVRTGGKEVLMTSVLTSCGFHYAPPPLDTSSNIAAAATASASMSSTSSQVDTDLASPTFDRRETIVLPIAGRWQIIALSSRLRHASGAFAVHLLHSMRMVGGSSRRTPFELICIENAYRLSSCLASSSSSQSSDASSSTAAASSSSASSTVSAASPLTARQRMGDLLPHLQGSPAADWTIGRLRVIAIPKVTERSSLLSSEEKTVAMSDRSKWNVSRRSTILPQDVHWLISQWLTIDTLAVPTELSGSQDWFIRAKEGLVGVSNKFLKAGLSFADVTKEVAKAPPLMHSDSTQPPQQRPPYVLLSYSPKMNATLQKALEGLPSITLTADSTHAADPTLSTLLREVDCSAVIVNPLHPQGLDALVTSRVGQELRELAEVGADDLTIISRLAELHGGDDEEGAAAASLSRQPSLKRVKLEG